MDKMILNSSSSNQSHNEATAQLSPPINLFLHTNYQQQNNSNQGLQFHQHGNVPATVTVSSSSNHRLPPPQTNTDTASALIFFGESHHHHHHDQFYISSSNNSPFQSAAEDPDCDDDDDGEATPQDHRNDDRNPLIFKGPPRQSVFHQFLSSAKGVVGNKGNKHPKKERDANGNLGSADKKFKLEGGTSQLNPPIQPKLFQDEAIDCSLQNLEEDEEGVDSPFSEADHEDQILHGNRSHHHHRSHKQNHRLKPPDSNLQPKSRTSCSIGILLASVSCIFFATSALIVKVSRLHPMQLLCVRGTLQAIFISPIVLSTGNSFLGQPSSSSSSQIGGTRALLLSRAVLGSVSLIMSFASIHLIPLADAATCIFTSPVWVSLFACICLGEVCSYFDVVMILLTFLGVVLVSQPSFHWLSFLDPGPSSGSYSSILGTLCGLAAAMLTALAFIVLRQLKHVHYSVVVFWFSVVLAGFGGVIMIALDGFRLPEDVWDVLDCVGIGICGFLGQILLTKALQIENAGPCAVARTLDIVLAFFYQITLLHDSPDWSSYLGSFLVVSCVLLTAFRRWYREKYGLERYDNDDGGHIEERGNHGAISSSQGEGSSSRRGEKSINIRNCSYTRANTGISQ